MNQNMEAKAVPAVTLEPVVKHLMVRQEIKLEIKAGNREALPQVKVVKAVKVEKVAVHLQDL